MSNNEKIKCLVDKYKKDIKDTSNYISEISGYQDSRSNDVIARLRDRNHVMRCLVESLEVLLED